MRTVITALWMRANEFPVCKIRALVLPASCSWSVSVHKSSGNKIFLHSKREQRHTGDTKGVQCIIYHIQPPCPPLQPHSYFLKRINCHFLPALQTVSSDFLIHLLTCSHFPHQLLTTYPSPDALFLCQLILVALLLACLVCFQAYVTSTRTFTWTLTRLPTYLPACLPACLPPCLPNCTCL